MKKTKLISTLIAAVCTVSVCNIGSIFNVHAVTGTYGSITYVTNGVEAVITDCNENATFEVIPSELDGLPVTKIESSAFKNCTKLNGVIIPDSVKNVGLNAFENCTALMDVSIPDTVTSISGYMFAGCKSLTSIKLPETTRSIGFDAFLNCINLTDFVIPDKVETIGASAFENCGSIEKMNIPDTVLSIGDSAFENCTSMKSCKIGKNVKVLGSYAYSNCQSLESIVIPKSVTSVGDGVFRNSFAMRSLKVEAGNNNYCDFENVLFNRNKTELISYPSGRKNPYYTVPKTVKKIHSYSFYGNMYLTEVTFPESLTEIGDYAFYSDDGTMNIKKSFYYKADKGVYILDNGEKVSSEYVITDQDIWKKVDSKVNKYNNSVIDGEVIYNYMKTHDYKPFVIADTIYVAYGYHIHSAKLTNLKITKNSKYNYMTDIYASDADCIYQFADETQMEEIRLLFCQYHLTDEIRKDADELSFTCIDDNTDTSVVITGKNNIDGNITVDKLIENGYIDRLSYLDIKSFDYDILNYYYVNEKTGTCTKYSYDKETGKISRLEFGVKYVNCFDSFDPEKNIALKPISYYPLLDTTANETNALDYEGYKYHKYNANNVGICGYDTKAATADIPEKIDRLAVTAIEDMAFYKCNDLQKVRISDSVETIGEYAFYFNSELESVTIPYSVSKIDANAFAGCTDIKDVYYNGTEDEWNTIKFGANNECLLNAVIHFNSTGPEETIKGDVNLDGKVNVSDIVLLQKVITGGEQIDFLADLNGDGVMNVFDVVYLRRILINM